MVAKGSYERARDARILKEQERLIDALTPFLSARTRVEWDGAVLRLRRRQGQCFTISTTGYDSLDLLIKGRGRAKKRDATTGEISWRL